MRTSGVGNNLNNDVRRIRQLDQPIQLPAHDITAPYNAMQYSLVDNSPQFRRVSLSKQFLPTEPRFDTLVDNIVTDFRDNSFMQGASIIGRLQQTWKNGRFVFLYLYRFGFHPDICRPGQVVGLPPPLLLALPRQSHQPSRSAWSRYAVEIGKGPGRHGE